MHDSGLWIPIVLFIMIALTIWSFLFFNNKNKKDQQLTLQKLIDSGQALSPELIASIAKPQKLPDSNVDSDFSKGLLAVGLAIAIFVYGYFGLREETEFMWFSVFPLMIGIAFLLIFKFKPKL
jgi:hypothetical protein